MSLPTQCLLCGEKLENTPEVAEVITYHNIACINGACSFESYADSYPFDIISEYDFTLDMDGKKYNISASNGEWLEHSSHKSSTNIIYEDYYTQVIRLDYYIPFQNDIKFYENFVKRIMGLKAFL